MSRDATTERMRAVYEREKRLRESAERTIRHDEMKPNTPCKQDPVTKRWNYYLESATAAKLREVFEDGVEPWW